MLFVVGKYHLHHFYRICPHLSLQKSRSTFFEFNRNISHIVCPPPTKHLNHQVALNLKSPRERFRSTGNRMMILLVESRNQVVSKSAFGSRSFSTDLFFMSIIRKVAARKTTFWYSRVTVSFWNAFCGTARTYNSSFCNTFWYLWGFSKEC